MVNTSKRAAALGFCRKILGRVSRTFALTIPVLPEPLADSVTCAYLLCRIADTIEDESALDPHTRARLFDLLDRLIDDPTDREALERFVSVWPAEREDDYSRLMYGASQVLEVFATLPEHQQIPIQKCAREMVSGMRAMTSREPGERITFVSSSLQDLERYCHYVAGTVGQMLTRLFSSHVGDEFATDERVEQGRRFGLGLQLVNILKDWRDDRKQRVSFIPQRWLREQGVHAEIDPRHKRDLVERTLSHLDVAHRYTLALPAQQPGIRLFCIWALWMAVATLREICTSTAETPKISREEVEDIITYSRQWVGDDDALERRYRAYRQQAAEAAARINPAAPPAR